MRELANYVMRGPRQATVVAFCGALVPMMFWISAAVIGLVTLRQGVQKGFAIFFWSMIPALGAWVGWQDPGALVVMLLTLVMASVLRTSVSWQSTHISGVLVTIFIGMIIPVITPEVIEALLSMADQIFREMAKNAGEEYDPNLPEAFRPRMIASFAVTLYVCAIGSTILARHWQAQLFNPGGWRAEFHQMRLSPLTMAGLVLMTVLAPSIGLNAELVVMAATIPALICGFALVHGVIGKKKLGGQWLFGFYLSVIMLFPLVPMLLVVFAIMDSLIDFRGQMREQA